MPVVLDVHQPKFRSMREQRPLRRNLGSTIARHANLYNSFRTVTQRRDGCTVHIAILKEHKPSIALFTGYQGLV